MEQRYASNLFQGLNAGASAQRRTRSVDIAMSSPAMEQPPLRQRVVAGGLPPVPPLPGQPPPYAAAPGAPAAPFTANHPSPMPMSLEERLGTLLEQQQNQIAMLTQNFLGSSSRLQQIRAA